MLNKDAIKSLYAEGVTIAELARQFNVSRQRIHQIVTGYKSFATVMNGRSFGKATTPRLDGVCKLCGVKAEVVHHIDKDSSNNNKDNLMPLCRKCHVLQHGGFKWEKPTNLVLVDGQLCCNDCGYIWMARTKNPKCCPRCHSYKWNDGHNVSFLQDRDVREKAVKKMKGDN